MSKPIPERLLHITIHSLREFALCYSRHPGSAACSPGCAGWRLRRFAGANRAKVAADEIDVLSRPNIFGGSPFFAPELAPSPGALAKKNVQKSPMATPILAQKSGHGACVVSLTAEKQPFPLKSGVHIASVMVTKMDFSVYENLCFFWILMPRGSRLLSFFKKGVCVSIGISHNSER